jgi:hypothetical protein
VLVYREYEIAKLPARAGSGWPLDHYYSIRWGGVVVCKQPSLDFAKSWIDQTQARFERLQKTGGMK